MPVHLRRRHPRPRHAQLLLVRPEDRGARRRADRRQRPPPDPRDPPQTSRPERDGRQSRLGPAARRGRPLAQADGRPCESRGADHQARRREAVRRRPVRARGADPVRRVGRRRPARRPKKPYTFPDGTPMEVGRILGGREYQYIQAVLFKPSCTSCHAHKYREASNGRLVEIKPYDPEKGQGGSTSPAPSRSGSADGPDQPRHPQQPRDPDQRRPGDGDPGDVRLVRRSSAT